MNPSLPTKFLVAAVAVAMGVCGSADAESERKDAPPIRIIKLEKAPEIDGDLSDPAWGDIARSRTGVFSGWTILQRAPLLAEQQRVAYAGYDENNLYIAMQSYATDIYRLQGGRGGNPFVGECLEIFLRTEEGKLFHIGVDVDGNINTGQTGEQVNLSPVEQEVLFGENYWALEIAIPWSLLGVEPEKGTVLGFNLGANSSQQRGGNTTITWGEHFGARSPMPEIQLD